MDSQSRTSLPDDVAMICGGALGDSGDDCPATLVRLVRAQFVSRLRRWLGACWGWVEFAFWRFFAITGLFGKGDG